MSTLIDKSMNENLLEVSGNRDKLKHWNDAKIRLAFIGLAYALVGIFITAMNSQYEFIDLEKVNTDVILAMMAIGSIDFLLLLISEHRHLPTESINTEQ